MRKQVTQKARAGDLAYSLFIWLFFVVGLYVYYTAENKDTAGLAMIGVWCLANIGRVLFTIFRPVDSVNEALERHKDSSSWFMGRLMGRLIVAIFWGIFLPIQILWVVYKLSQAKKQASVLHQNQDIANSINM